MKRCVPLEPQVEAVCQASSKSPPIFELPVVRGRMVLEGAQDSSVYKHPAWVERMVVNAGRWGVIPVYLTEPETVCIPANAILYIHGAGWVLSSYHTHEKLARELVAGAGLLLTFPGYSRSLEIWYPTTVEQCHSVICMVPELARNMGYTTNPDTLTVAGGSVGGSMATALTLMSELRRDLAIQKRLLYYLVTNACFNMGSYCEFVQGYYSYRAGMEWPWNQYTMSRRGRNQITVSPLRVDLEQLRGLPDTMILNRGTDAFRDEGEAYVVKLRQTGMDITAVRFQVIIHDSAMLDSLDQTEACRVAMDMSTKRANRKNMEKQ